MSQTTVQASVTIRRAARDGKPGTDGKPGRDALTVQPNLLRGAGFVRGASAWEQLAGSGQTSDGLYGQGLYSLGTNKATSPYIDVLRQTLISSGGQTDVLTRGAWMTFSFYVRAASAGVGGAPLRTHIYRHDGNGEPSPINTTAGCYIDGVKKSTAGGDGGVEWGRASGTEWVRHTYTFRVSAYATGTVYLLFRLMPAAGSGDTEICCPKLELSTEADTLGRLDDAATPWCLAEQDRAGVEGCIMRVTEWTAGTEYHNDTDLAATAEGQLRYIDIVTHTNAEGVVTGRWQCRVTHTASADNNPATHTDANGNSAQWQRLSAITPLYASLLLADNAAIRFAQANRLVIVGSDGKICAALQGGDTPLWIGGENADAAPVSFSSDGSGRLASGGITWDSLGSLSIAGFIRKRKTVITSANADTYLKEGATDTGTDGTKRRYYTLDVSKLAGWVELGPSLPSERWSLYFPEAKYGDKTTNGDADAFDNALSYVGATILITNRTGTTMGHVTLNNVYSLQPPASGTSGAAAIKTQALTIELAKNEAMWIECILASPNAYGRYAKVCWAVRSFHPDTGSSQIFKPGTEFKPSTDYWTVDPGTGTLP